MLYSFLWSGRSDNIKREVIISDYKKARKSTWVKKYLDNENHGKWNFSLSSNKTISAESLYIYRTLLKQKL